MKFQRQLHQLVNSDVVVQNLPEIDIFLSNKDRNHFNRRLQQRAINCDMIRLAIAYGKFEYFSKAQTWTLLDKNLLHTPYNKFIDKLRGLRIIAPNCPWHDNLRLSTAYWAYDLRR